MRTFSPSAHGNDGIEPDPADEDAVSDSEAFIRLELLLTYLAAPDTPARGLYAGYIWDGSEGRRTAPLRDPSAK